MFFLWCSNLQTDRSCHTIQFHCFLCFCFFCFLRNSEMTCLSVEIDTYCYSVHYFIVIVIVIVVIVVGLCHYLFCETLMGLGARAPEAFREDCARIWGNLYDYSMTKYQENRMGIPWISWCFLNNISILRLVLNVLLQYRTSVHTLNITRTQQLPRDQHSMMAHELPGCFSQDNHTPVLIGCPLHGVFRLRPRDHLQRRLGCPKCGSSIPGSVDGSAAAVLKAFSKTPRLGQHLLQSYAVADAIARAAVGSGGSGGWVAEIGVGTGILTSALLRRPECTGVVGFEMDEEILKEGRAKDGETWKFTTCPESQVVVVSNIPQWNGLI